MKCAIADRIASTCQRISSDAMNVSIDMASSMKISHCEVAHPKQQRGHHTKFPCVHKHKRRSFLQKEKDHNKSQNWIIVKKVQGLVASLNVSFRSDEVLKMLRWLAMSKLFYKQLLVHPGHIYTQKNTILSYGAEVVWPIMVFIRRNVGAVNSAWFPTTFFLDQLQIFWDRLYIDSVFLCRYGEFCEARRN